MSTYSEMKDIPEKFRSHTEKLINLLNKYEIKGIRGLVRVYKTDEEFREEWKAIWTDIAKADGGKLSLTTVGVIIGAVLGGVGIAAMGGAIGMPLALILGLGGFIAGTKFDDTKVLADKKTISITLPNEIVDRLKEDAEKIGCSTDELVKILIEQVYNIS